MSDWESWVVYLVRRRGRRFALPPQSTGRDDMGAAWPVAGLEKKFVPNGRIHGFIQGMNIQVAVLCDAATNDHEKLNLLGAFDTIYAQQLPAVHPQCSVALRLTFTAGDEGHHQLTLNFVNADGRTIMPPMDLPVSITLPDDVDFLTRNFIVNIQQLKFNEAGLFSLDILLDGRPQASIPLLVKNVPPQPGGLPGLP